MKNQFKSYKDVIYMNNEQKINIDNYNKYRCDVRKLELSHLHCSLFIKKKNRKSVSYL